MSRLHERYNMALARRLNLIEHAKRHVKHDGKEKHYCSITICYQHELKREELVLTELAR